MKSIMYFMGQAAVSVLLLLSAGGCTDKVEVDVPAYDEGDDVPIVIRASDEMLGTATRAGDGTITDGQVKNSKDFLFTYPAKDGKMNSLPCRFDDRGYGYVYISDEQTLTRGDILFKKDKEGKEVAEVYLDNLVDYPVQEANETKGKYDNFTRMEFGSLVDGTFNPYYMVAPDGGSVIPQAPEDPTSTTDGDTKKWDVDILWGKLTYAKTDKLLDFKLRHKMSKVTFRFFSNDKIESGINSKLQRENITVELENIKTAVYDKRTDASRIPGFRRDKGEIVSTSADDNKNTVIILSSGKLDEKAKSDGAESETYYYAPAYIFPPHNYSAATQDYKAKLTIDLGNGEKYSGPFPSTMLYTIKGENSTADITVSDDMAFLSGYHLIIDVELADNFDDRELLFHGIKVADFKCDFTETNNESRECGIYSLEDLETLIALYNSLGDDKEDYRLYKYGTYGSGDTWTFNLWIDIVISEEEMSTFEKFNNENFELELNGYKILKVQGSTEAWTKDDLCDKKTASSTSPTSKTNMP